VIKNSSCIGASLPVHWRVGTDPVPEMCFF
jgi:hypothetical protein